MAYYSLKQKCCVVRKRLVEFGKEVQSRDRRLTLSKHRCCLVLWNKMTSPRTVFLNIFGYYQHLKICLYHKYIQYTHWKRCIVSCNFILLCVIHFVFLVSAFVFLWLFKNLKLLYVPQIEKYWPRPRVRIENREFQELSFGVLQHLEV